MLDRLHPDSRSLMLEDFLGFERVANRAIVESAGNALVCLLLAYP